MDERRARGEDDGPLYRAEPMGLARISSIDYVVLLCDDVPAMVAFYRDVLGLPARERTPNWTELTVGGTVLALRPRGRGPADGPPVPDSAAVQLAFRVPLPAVDAWHQELLAKQAKILQPPQHNTAFGHYTLFFADPEGNLLEIYAET